MTELTNNIAVTLIYAIYLLLPGYILLSCVGVKRNLFLLSGGISISIIVLTLIPLYGFGVSIGIWLGVFHLVIAALILGVWLRPTTRHVRKTGKTRIRRTTSKNLYGFGFIFVLASFGLYHLIVGPYTEIPSDFWKHLARVGVESDEMTDGYLGHLSVGILDSTGLSPVYVLHAVVAHLLDTNPLELVTPATLVTSGLFLGSIYWFTLSLLGRFSLGASARTTGALLATALTFVTFGTASFSYVRYYAYFPTIFTFPLIFAATAILLNYLERPKNNGLQLLLLPIFLATMWLIHRQEALLTLSLLAGITVVRATRSYLPAVGLSTTLKVRARSSVKFFLALLALVTIYAFTVRTMAPWDHTPHVVDAGKFIPLLAGLPMDNPLFRFWDTLGYFGLVVYVWSILRWKTLFRSDFLSAGMLMPFLTNLNPLYAVLFLHFGTAPGLWRTAYLIPLGIVTAILFSVTFLSKPLRVTVRGRTVGWVVILLLIFTMVPWHYQGHFNRTSRAPSLSPVHKTSGAGLWQDLIETVDQIQVNRPVRRIISDSVTRFVLYSATRSEVWWWSEGEFFPRHREGYPDDYQEDFLTSDFRHSLLVINKRDGVVTDSARYSGHWPSSVLKVSQHYPKDLDGFIAAHPKLFKLLWSTDDARIYLMHP